MNNEYIYKYTMSHELLDIYYSLLTINKENKKIDEIDKENIGGGVYETYETYDSGELKALGGGIYELSGGEVAKNNAKNKVKKNSCKPCTTCDTIVSICPYI